MVATTIKPSWLAAHRAIHSSATEVVMPSGNKYPINGSTSGGKKLRSVTFNDADFGQIMLIEQNPKKSSSYAKRARNGETLTWIFPQYILIDEPIKKPDAIN